ncbi:MAG: hypothetical protein QXH37_08320, partial [Candidatus Bathyarchaeia archaeon]
MKRLKVKMDFEKVFLITQDTNYLKGRYLTAAVVVARSKSQALSRLMSYLADDKNVICKRNRLEVAEVGMLIERLDAILSVNRQHLK